MYPVNVISIVIVVSIVQVFLTTSYGTDKMRGQRRNFAAIPFERESDDTLPAISRVVFCFDRHFTKFQTRGKTVSYAQERISVKGGEAKNRSETLFQSMKHRFYEKFPPIDS